MQIDETIKNIQHLFNYDYDASFDESFDFIDSSIKFKEIAKSLKKLNTNKIVSAEEIKIKSNLAKIDLEDKAEQAKKKYDGIVENDKKIKEQVAILQEKFPSFEKDSINYVLAKDILNDVVVFLNQDQLIITDLSSLLQLYNKMINFIEVRNKQLTQIEDRIIERDKLENDVDNDC